MSQHIVSRELAENGEQPRPAAALVDAMAAVLENDPGRPIALTEGVFVRAAYLVEALAPEALERARALHHFEGGQQ